jgi:hypothetical protein
MDRFLSVAIILGMFMHACSRVDQDEPQFEDGLEEMNLTSNIPWQVRTTCDDADGFARCASSVRN